MDTNTAVAIAQRLVSERKDELSRAATFAKVVECLGSDTDQVDYIAAHELIADMGYVKVTSSEGSTKKFDFDFAASLRTHMAHVHGDDEDKDDGMPGIASDTHPVIYDFLRAEEAFREDYGPVPVFKNPKTKSMVIDARGCESVEFHIRSVALRDQMVVILAHNKFTNEPRMFTVDPQWKVKVI